MRYLIAIFLVLAFGALPAAAQCVGRNLLAEMPDAAMAELRQKANEAPFAEGNYWRATKGNQEISLIGTYHFDDPRHDATLAALMPALMAATSLLVEAGPEEEAALIARIAAEPEMLIKTDGPTLRESLSDEDWDKLADAASARGMPPFMISKFQPWYVSVLLAVPACQTAQAAMARGLDGALVDAATAAEVPIQSLEPYDTVFGVFQSMSEADQLAMITASLATETQSEDFAVTLADSYFAQDARLFWEFMKQFSATLPGNTPEQVEAEFALMEQNLMITRNRAWIPVITDAAAKGPVLVAFGALHLAGEDGVLNLLAKEGYTVERRPLE